MCNATKQEIKKNSKEAGIFSVVVLFMLTGLGFYAVNRLNEPAHSDACSTGKPAFWALSNFYFSIFGGGIGALYELYLLLIDKVFEVETIAVIPRIRGFNAGYIFSVGLMFVSSKTLYFLLFDESEFIIVYSTIHLTLLIYIYIHIYIYI